jgi:hypothetical protein
MGMIGISRAVVRDEIGATLHEQVGVRGAPGGNVQVHDRTGTLIRIVESATVTMLAPDLYRVTGDAGATTLMVERMAASSGCGCGK